jgi:polyadenylate-binding protein
VTLTLSPYPPTTPPTPLPPPNALPRLVKQLPEPYSDSQLYDTFRPFGSLASVRVNTSFGPDTAVIEYWNEEEARNAEETMHCSEIEGNMIAVALFDPTRRHPGAAMADFVPGGVGHQMEQQAQGTVSQAGHNVNAPIFVPGGGMTSPGGYPAGVSSAPIFSRN